MSDIESKAMMMVRNLDIARNHPAFADAAFFALGKCEIGNMRPFGQALTSLYGLKETYLREIGMFLVKLLVCSMLHSNSVLISDTNGPLQTQDEC